MGWERYLTPTTVNSREADELGEQLQRMVESRRSQGADPNSRIRELEDDLGRVALLARSLAELCLRKNLITAEELKSQLFAVDLDDGIGDQRLDPKLVIPIETKAASNKRTPPKKNK